MAGKIDAAADHGVDAFLFDWYSYADGPYLERALEQGFWRAPNHDWLDIHPAKPDEIRRGVTRLLYPGPFPTGAGGNQGPPERQRRAQNCDDQCLAHSAPAG